jgi:hypothetical protein
MSWHLRLCDRYGREERGKGEVSTSEDEEGKSLQSMFFEALEEEECSSSIVSDVTGWGEKALITD